MHDDRAITERRLDRFLADRILAALYRRRAALGVSAWVVPGEPVPVDEALAQQYTPIEVGTPWGRPWGTTWFQVVGEVPADWSDDGGLPAGTRLEAVIDLGFRAAQPGFQAEGLAYTPDGRSLKAVAPRNTHLPWSAEPGERVEFYLEGASNPDVAAGFTFAPTPLGDLATAGDAPLYRLGRIDIALLDEQVWALAQDVAALRGLMYELPVDRPRRHEILRALERMLDVLDPDDVSGSAAAGRHELADVLASPATASAHRLYAVGHAHIDSAWLWPVRETVRKCARTFSNVLSLMEDYPDFAFACSSAQQLRWMKDHHPELFERITKRVATGQFVPVGGMWVESDTNLPGGEAMARQFVAGKRFFLEEFGVECEEVWLPDSFGYSAGLPQIAAAAGARWFLTQKISWNQVNRMPHHTFWWEGIDGTRVFTHFPPVDSYESDLGAKDLAHAERNFADHGRGHLSLVPFGYGDGGGGPTREMIEAGHRARSLEGSPVVQLASPAQFFTDAQADDPHPPVWSGEMYLELHRGTYTSQARTKHGNRRSEHLLREAELWASTAAVRAGAAYPREDLERIWHTVLLQQFHDILPGSSIAWVHREAERRYAEVAGELESIIESSLRFLAGDGDRVIVANAGPFRRAGVPALGATARGTGDTVGDAAEAVAGVGAEVVAEPVGGGAIVLRNDVVSATIDAAGLVVSLRELASGREGIAPGGVGNLLQLHRDLPNAWDAWDVDEHYRRNVTDLVDADAVELTTTLDGRAAVRVERRFGSSTVRQLLTLVAGEAALDITTTVDWHERQKLLKLAFALDVHADRSAAETQFGHVYRPTHTNTSWEAAKFEICAHRWIHVGEPGFGVAVANDATYGHDVTRGERAGGGTITTVRQSLLRAPLFPDPDADQGEHTMRTRVVVGAGIAEAVRAGYALNLPERVVVGAHDIEPLVEVDHPGVVVEAVKLAEDGSGDVVVRLYESLGARAAVAIRPGFDVSGVRWTDLLERDLGLPEGAAVGADGTVEAQLRPFQLVTLRFVRA
ncbi:MAG TPA: glycoside hydrolase family 38 C-terminal domain-containing protein [Jiangellaceae bacterium]